MVGKFSDKDKYEFMLLDSYGGVIASSSRHRCKGIITCDFERAQDAVDGQGIAICTQSGEIVARPAVSLLYAAEMWLPAVSSASLTLVEEQLKRTVVVALIADLRRCALYHVSRAMRVRSIVVPWDRWSAPPPASPEGVRLDVHPCPSPATSGMRWTMRGTINRMAEGLEETER